MTLSSHCISKIKTSWAKISDISLQHKHVSGTELEGCLEKRAIGQVCCSLWKQYIIWSTNIPTQCI